MDSELSITAIQLKLQVLCSEEKGEGFVVLVGFVVVSAKSSTEEKTLKGTDFK